MQMEEHYLNTTFMSDLRATIFQKKHNMTQEVARQGVLKDKIDSIIKECDPLVERIKEYNKKEKITEEEAKDCDELKEKLVERWRLKKYYQDQFNDSEGDLAKFMKELDTLRGLLAHIELCHPNVAQ